MNETAMIKNAKEKYIGRIMDLTSNPDYLALLLKLADGAEIKVNYCSIEGQIDRTKEGRTIRYGIEFRYYDKNDSDGELKFTEDSLMIADRAANDKSYGPVEINEEQFYIFRVYKVAES